MASVSPSISDVEGAGVTLKSGSALLAVRASERVVAQQAYASDPKFKKYTQQVEKCLSSFDSVQEWADFIAFLKQLLKTFQSYMQFKEIPRKLIVAKRLAQCLNPALPTGVHQRALDVYAHILAVLGSEGLKRDLALWSSGLFPFFEYAATSVKPTLLNLYDTHYLPLQAGLRPIMKSFILALLPGLEEETGEFFEKVLSLLDRLSGTVSPSFFFQNIWLVMLATPSARGTSLNLLSRRLPRLNPNEDIAAVVGDDIGLMIRAFAAALEDENLLVRRGALDLLLQSIRVDSVAIQRAQAEDRAIIMRAATSVVLRRDLSLNRRLYTWLLGPEDKSEVQVAYFREHALGLLKGTLKDEMVSPSGEYSESRPFKIFISLLDKWEIGGPLTDALVLDAFKAVKYLVENRPDSRDDVMMTASTLYEAVEPQILWKHILAALFNETLSNGSSFEVMRMVNFILQNFAQDEDIQTLHLPVIFSGCLDLVHLHFLSQPHTHVSASILECLYLEEQILRHIPHSALMHPPEVVSEIQKARADQHPYQFACTFYGLTPQFSPVAGGSSSVPFTSSFETLTRLSTHFASQITSPASVSVTPPSSLTKEALAQVLLLTDRLIGRLGASTAIEVSWNPKAWSHAILATFESEHNESISFTIVDRAVGLSVVLYQLHGLKPPLLATAAHRKTQESASGLSTPTLGTVLAASNTKEKEKVVISAEDIEEERRMAAKMVKKLLQYLGPEYSAYHVRAVNLIWAIENVTQEKAYVESIVAQSLTRPDARGLQGAFDAFGVLWRLTEDHLQPGFKFKVPMMIVLDTLKSEDPHLRRIGETWMRCSLKAFSRVLDPILFDLLDPTVRRKHAITKIRGRELQIYEYERPFDQRYMNHLLVLLQCVAQFGAQAFAKTIRSVYIRRSHHIGLDQRVDSIGLAHADATYLDVLIELLLKFLRSEPSEAGQVSMNSLNSQIHSTVVDLLQTIVARGEIDIVSIEAIEAIVVPKLFFCVHTKRLDLQNKLLHLLHSLTSVMTSYEAMSRANAPNKQDAGSDSLHHGETAEGVRTYSLNPLLTQTLVDGISLPSNRPVLQHWLDFVLMTVPQFQPALQPLVIPLSECIYRQLLLALEELHNMSNSSPSSIQDVRSRVTDAEFTMLLNGLERLILLGLAHSLAETSTTDDDANTLEKSVSESSGLFGYVSGVFGADTPQQQPEEQLTIKSTGYRTLHEGVKVLYLIWSTLGWMNPEERSSKDDSLSLIYSRTRLRARRVLEHLFRAHSAEVFESIVDWWNRDLGFSVPVNAAFELVDLLMASAQNAVHMMCESISFRMTGVSEKSRRQVINPDLSDVVLFTFMEQYFQRLEGPLAVQVWGRFLQLVKDIIGSSRDTRTQNFFSLRCLAVLAEKVTQTTALEDKRIKKELQDNLGKLLDACVAFVGRSSDSSSWLRRGPKDVLMNGRDSPAPRDLKIDEKMDASTLSLPTVETPVKVNTEVDLITQINQFLATTGIPNLRRFFTDNDKVASACSNIVYYIIGPAMKGKARPMDIDENALAILYEMSRLLGVLKVWRPPVLELLNDNRLFNCGTDAATKWRPIIKTLFDADKTAMPELLAKIATAPSTNIFTNKEYEMLLRSLNVRRLAYVIFTAEKNHFLTQLPTIQEKLVDILRNVSSPVVQSEVFLCIRVLLCRLSPHNLTSFWPVLFTELYRIFEQVITNLPADGSEDLQLILASCKCLDLLLVLQTEEFQIHQWVFITDTVDAIYRPDGWFPEALMDQLAEIANSLPVVDTHEDNPVSLGPQTPALPNQRPMRRPMLNALKQIDSIRDLVPFFSAVSISSYESVYASGGNIDWDEVERGIMNDTFDG
ncbi:hypothetical protein AX16_000383 [Volvariella volvacea WC 439]|nr:hypothetical protein AX16_000383 [Volvariella volvacea WC 439]